MSIPVDLADLEQVAASHPFAYVLTVGDGLRPHLVAVRPRFDGPGELVAEVGRTTLANVAARPDITLVWPPVTPDGYSLVVDARAHAGTADGTIAISAVGAVLHRPAP